MSFWLQLRLLLNYITIYWQVLCVPPIYITSGGLNDRNASLHDVIQPNSSSWVSGWERALLGQASVVRPRCCLHPSTGEFIASNKDDKQLFFPTPRRFIHGCNLLEDVLFVSVPDSFFYPGSWSFSPYGFFSAAGLRLLFQSLKPVTPSEVLEGWLQFSCNGQCLPLFVWVTVSGVKNQYTSKFFSPLLWKWN